MRIEILLFSSDSIPRFGMQQQLSDMTISLDSSAEASFNAGADTIAAIATAPGEGAVSIIRLSGPASLRISDAVFRPLHGPCPSQRRSHTVTLGRVVAADGAVLDETLMLVMRAPHSYTGEDVVEFQGHGGRIASGRILNRVLECGARPADPGEFTRRAFLDGRMDMLQAESVLDLVRAQSDKAAAQAVEQMEGGLSREVNAIYDLLLGSGTEIEATLDFSEDEIPQHVVPESIKSIRLAIEHADRLLASWNEGRALREGIRVAILGRPNAGKSSLFNLLLGHDRAIVTPHPGTTRDTLEEPVSWGGWPVRLVDTAGLRETECAIEQEGVRRSRQQQSAADLTLYVVDAHQPPHPDDRTYLASASPERTLLVLNKADLGAHEGWKDPCFANEKTFSIATQDAYRKHIIDFCTIVINRVYSCPLPHAGAVSARHRAELESARDGCREAVERLTTEGAAGAVLACESLRSAMDALGRLTGRQYSQELMDSIFNRFCIGK